MRVLLCGPRIGEIRSIRNLLFGCWCHGRRFAETGLPNLPLADLGAVLEQEGHEVRLRNDTAHPRPVIDVGIMFPFPGSELYDRIQQEEPTIGGGTSHLAADLHRASICNDSICSLTPVEFSEAAASLSREFYRTPGAVLRNLAACTSPRPS